MANNYLRLAMEESPRYEGAPVIAPYRVSTAAVYLPVTSGRINAVPSHIDRGNELRNIQGDVPLVVETFAPDGALAQRAYLNHLVFLLSLAGFKGTVTPGDGTNQVWTLTTAAATGGTYTLTFGGQTTTPLAWNATTATIQAALEALSTIGVGNVAVAGGPLPGTNVTITFRRALGGAIQTLTGTFTGLVGTPYTLTNTTPGVAPTVTNPDWVTGETFAAQPQHFVGPGAQKWVFTKRVGAQAQTAELIAAYGDMGVWLKGQGYGVTTLGMNAAGELTADLAGLYVAPVTDPGYTPVLDSQSVLPARRGDLTLTWLSGGGTIDDFSFSLSNPLNPVRSLGLAVPSAYPDVMDFGDDWPQLTGSIPQRRINSTDFTAVLQGTTFSAKARWLSAGYVADSSSRYTLWNEMPAAQLRAATPDDLYARRRFGASYDFWGAWDEASGYDTRFTIVCGVTAAQLSAPFTI